MEGESHTIAEVPEAISLLMIHAPTGETWIALLGLLFLLVASALVSGSETAYFSLTPKDVALLEERNTKVSNRVLFLLRHPRYLLSTILISNNFINVAIGLLSYFVISQIFQLDDLEIAGFVVPGNYIDFTINAILATGVLVLFGEVSPKIYANSNNLTLARFMSGPLRVLFGFYKATFLSTALVESILFIERKLAKANKGDMDLDEIDKAIDLTESEGVTNEDIKLLKGIVHFGNTTVSQIMKPRTEVVAIEEQMPFGEVMQLIKQSGYSRIPVYREDLDNIIGVLYIKDLLNHLDADDHFDWKAIIREAIFAPAGKKIDDLLDELREKRTHLAIVVDEYGGTSGIVTLEDIVEEVVGEIKDEFDDLIEMSYKKIDNNTFVFEGKALLNDVCKVTGIDFYTFDEIKGEADSLAGLLLEIAGKIPSNGEEITWSNYHFKVMSASANRIERIRLTLEAVEDA